MRAVVPRSVRDKCRLREDKAELRRTPTAEFKVDNLLSVADVHLDRIMNSSGIKAAWDKAEPRLRALEVPDGTGGANPGDRRAIFYLIAHFRARRVLEVGTLVGASTMAAALALSLTSESDGDEDRLVTVDIHDVNDPVVKPWLRLDSKHSPAELMKQLGLSKLVRFVKSPSVDYIANCKERFDLVYLDGALTAKAIYCEVAGALPLLNPGGVILVHAYCPDMKPLWSDKRMQAGPYLAVQRIMHESAPLRAVPLGALPWPTKLGSNVTSLALIARDS